MKKGCDLRRAILRMLATTRSFSWEMVDCCCWKACAFRLRLRLRRSLLKEWLCTFLVRSLAI